ncbi:hypothetical protein IE53DRAFT_239986 [Violaceomyces palustris]|uniref:Uncharacterized protein n=1 Tax=Violaceomyces palustris TaxID=1673888 RepID=A0ACD0P8C3_9BASI|nr:hypothetical protein IE53DRAFT_239986 [Violaceomyces palustris]
MKMYPRIKALQFGLLSTVLSLIMVAMLGSQNKMASGRSIVVSEGRYQPGDHLLVKRLSRSLEGGVEEDYFLTRRDEGIDHDDDGEDEKASESTTTAATASTNNTDKLVQDAQNLGQDAKKALASIATSPCTMGCAKDSLAKASCATDFSDMNCMCKNPSFLGEVTTCITSKCSSEVGKDLVIFQVGEGNKEREGSCFSQTSSLSQKKQLLAPTPILSPCHHSSYFDP